MQPSKDAGLKLVVEDYVSEATMGSWVDEASDKEVCNTCTLLVEKSPPRLLFIFDDKDGKRMSDAPVRDALYQWSDMIVGGVQAFKNSKVKVTGDADSSTDPGKKSMLTGPMDDHVTYDKFWAQHLKYCKDFVRNAFALVGAPLFVSSGLDHGTGNMCRAWFCARSCLFTGAPKLTP